MLPRCQGAGEAVHTPYHSSDSTHT